MAKSEPKPFKPGELEQALVQLANSGPNSIGFISKELVKIATQENGKFDITSQPFAESIAKLATNPNPGPYSLKESEDNLNKDIEKLVARGADPKLFSQMRADFASSKADLLQSLQTNEGLAHVIAKTVTNQIILDKADFYLLDAESKPRPMTPAEKMSYVKVIQQITEPLSPEALAIMLDPKNVKEKELIKSFIYGVAVEAFAPDNNKQIKDNWAQLDSEKFKDPTSQKKFNDLIKANLANITTNCQANILVKQTIEQMEKEQKIKFTPERVEKITKALVPTLAKLGPEYLEQNKGDLAKELTTSLTAGKGYSTSFTGSYTISTEELGKIASKMEKKHQPEADKGSVEKVNDVMYKRQMTNGDIAVKLNSFAEKTGMTKDGKPLTFDAKTIPDNAAIAKMRQSNPTKFDSIFNAPKSPSQPTPVVEKAKPVVKEIPVEVIVPKKPEILPEGPAHGPLSAPPSLVTPPLITPTQVQPSAPKLQSVSVAAPQKVSVDSPQNKLAKEIINDAIKAEGHKITPERVEKITKALAPTLAKLGPEYLEQNKGDLAKELTTSLTAGKGYSTSFTGSYTISTEELGKIASKMEKKHQPEADKGSVEKVNDVMYKRQMTNGDIAVKLNSFAEKTGMTKDGKPLTFDAKTIPDNAAIAKMRQSNPTKFDSIFNAPPKLLPNLAKQAGAIGHDHNLPHPPPGRGGQTAKPLPPPPKRPQSKGNDGVGGRS